MAEPNSPSPRKTVHPRFRPMGLRALMELFDIGPVLALTALGVAVLILTAAVAYFIHSAPPSTITISSGPKGSIFQKNALKYAKVFERNGIKVNVLTSKGSLENIARLNDPRSGVDIGIVQSGVQENETENLISLGSISYQPLLVFYRGKPVDLLSEFAGKRVAIGPAGSGTRNFALSLLKLNGIDPGGRTVLLDWDATEAAEGLQKGTLDAAFVMSEDATTDILHKLLRSSNIHLFSFKQATAYARKIDYLSVLEFPEGSIDFGLDIPAHDIHLLGPMVELIATPKLNPALVDLLIEAATETHSHPGLFQKRGEFPAPIHHTIRLSEDAVRYYKSGKSFLYLILPFWLATLLSRFIVIFLPVAVLLIPALRSIPAAIRWTTQRKIHRRYRDLRSLEHDFYDERDPTRRAALRKEFDRIDESADRMKVSDAFADQIYALRGHIDYVRTVISRESHEVPRP